MSSRTMSQIVENLRPLVQEMRRISPDDKNIELIEKSLSASHIDRVIYEGLYLLFRSDNFLEGEFYTLFVEAANDLGCYDWMQGTLLTLESWLYTTYTSLKYRIPKKQRKKLFSFIEQKKYRSATKLLLEYVPEKRKFYRVLIKMAAVRTGLIPSEWEQWTDWLTDFVEELRGQVSDESIEYFKKNLSYGDSSVPIFHIQDELAQSHAVLEKPLYNKLKRAVSSVIEEDEDIEEYMKDIGVKE